jgi:SAM-dependent methyltransferase
MDLASTWEQHAVSWIGWARAPGHDGFWEGTWPALRDIVPTPGGLVLDVACGEGRVGRELIRLGHTVIGVDRSKTMARAGGTGDGALPVACADAAALPLPDRSVATVVACMCLQDVDDLPGSVREMARVLRPGGCVCIALVHPIANCSPDPSTPMDDQYLVSRPYLLPRRMEIRIERGGLAMTFVSMHRPLSAYVGAMADAGLAVTDLREHGDGVVPWLLVMRAVPVGEATH